MIDDSIVRSETEVYLRLIDFDKTIQDELKQFAFRLFSNRLAIDVSIFLEQLTRNLIDVADVTCNLSLELETYMIVDLTFKMKASELWFRRQIRMG
jgi:hypothetical protein